MVSKSEFGGTGLKIVGIAIALVGAALASTGFFGAPLNNGLGIFGVIALIIGVIVIIVG